MKCLTLATLIFLTPMSASAQDGAPAALGDSVKTVAVLGFVGQGISADMMHRATNRFHSLYAQATAENARIRVLTRATVTRRLGDAGLMEQNCFEAQCAATFGAALGVDRVIVGRMVVEGSWCTIRALSVDVAAERVVAATRESCHGSEVDAGLRRIAARMAVAGTLSQSAAENSPCDDWNALHQVLAGLGGGVLGGVAGALAGQAIDPHDPDELFGNAGRGIGSLVGYVVGTSGGVYLAGNAESATGCYLATLGGTVLGVAGGVALASALDSPVAIVPLLIAGPLCATAAYTLACSCEEPQEQHASALLTYRAGRLELGMPAHANRISPIDGTTMQTVDVLRVRF